MSNEPTQPNNNSQPTADDLAGIPVCIDVPEDLTFRPRRSSIRPRPIPVYDGRKPTADDLGGIPVCIEDTKPKSPGSP
jgi:hypothetical protein